MSPRIFGAFGGAVAAIVLAALASAAVASPSETIIHSFKPGSTAAWSAL